MNFEQRTRSLPLAVLTRLMFLAIDIGNSTIKFGVFDGDILTTKFTIPTKRDSSDDDLARAISEKLIDPVSTAFICSVVPELDQPLSEAIKTLFGLAPVIINNNFDFGLKINYSPGSSLGTDRLVNSFAAVSKYGKPVIACSFGTATTIDGVNSGGEYLGGVIAPGMKTMADALHLTTSKLPHVEIKKPQTLIGNSTVASIQSGIFYGYIGLVDGILARMMAELRESPKVVATGGFAKLISENCLTDVTVDENLTLEGIRLLGQNRLR